MRALIYSLSVFGLFLGSFALGDELPIVKIEGNKVSLIGSDKVGEQYFVDSVDPRLTQLAALSAEEASQVLAAVKDSKHLKTFKATPGEMEKVGTEMQWWWWRRRHYHYHHHCGYYGYRHYYPAVYSYPIVRALPVFAYPVQFAYATFAGAYGYYGGYGYGGGYGYAGNYW